MAIDASQNRTTAETHEPSERQLWFGVAAGPIAWSVQLLVNYGFASAFACELGWTWLIYSVTLVAAAITLAGAIVAWRAWNVRGEDAGSALKGIKSRQGFMAALGFSISLLTLTGIVLNGVPPFVIGVCA